MKIPRYIKLAVALMLFLACLGLGAYAFLQAEIYRPAGEEVEAVRQRIRDERYIIHAGGFLTTDDGEQVSLTNSYEGLIQLWEKGRRVCEFDIRMTTDGVPVCAHNSKDCFAYGTDLPAEVSSEEFLSAKIFGQFTPMTVDDLAGFMRTHKELLVITDIKDDNIAICRILAETYPDLTDRFIIQIYHEDEYEPVREMGFRFIIFTLYRTDKEEKDVFNLYRAAHRHELVGYTIKYSLYSNSPRWSYGVRKTGAPVMLHTVNDREVIEECLEHDICIGVYTDITDFPE